MSTYRVKAPDGNTYTLDGPEGASQAEIEQEVMRQHPHLAKTAETKTAPPETSAAQSFLRGAASLADNTIGGVIPFVAGNVAYAGARALGKSPEEATQIQRSALDMTDSPFGKALGVTTTPEYQNELSRRALGVLGGGVQNAAGAIAAKTGMPQPDVENSLQSVLAGAAPGLIKGAKAGVARVGRAVEPAVGATVDTLGAGANKLTDKIAEVRQNSTNNKIAASYENAPKIDAAKDAKKYGISINPSTSNPGILNNTVDSIIGPESTNSALSKSNLSKWNSLAREDMGLPSTTRLDKAAFDAAHSKPELTKPYEEIKKIKELKVGLNEAAQIDYLRKDSLLGSEGASEFTGRLLDNTYRKLSKGMNGEEALDDIRNLRRNATAIYKTQESGLVAHSPSQMALADTQVKVADILESGIESNLKDPKLIEDFRVARAKHAQLYDWERATNTATGQVDPQFFAKRLADNKPLSEKQRAIGNIAANYPEIARLNSNEPLTSRLGRTGALATVGLLTTGGNPLGGLAGAAAQEGLRAALLKRVKSQNRTVPKDYRNAFSERE